MWVFMILVWRMVTKLLRRFGRWALLVPVAMIGAAVFGLNVWTAGTFLLALLLAVLLALALAGRRPAGTSGPLPLTMLGAGLCGLWAAASTAKLWAWGQFSLWDTVNVFARPAKAAGPVVYVPTVKSSPRTWPVPALPAGGNVAARVATAVRAKLNALAHGKGQSPVGGKIIYRAARPHVTIIHGPPLWWGRLLILASLLLLAIGLWLAPRALADLRVQYAKVAPHLRRWVWEGNWGILLVPVTSLGLTIFGVRAWTVAAIVAAMVITIRWPRLAADLVPLLLIAFALYGFLLVARWPAGPRVFAAQAAAHFGAVRVDSPQSSLLAGVEASVLLAFGAWLFPRTVGAHARARGMAGQQAELAGRVRRLTETREHAVDTAAAELRRIERDLHDGAQARLVALGMNLRALERMLPASSPAALALVAEARDTSLRALNDLRHLVRGIYPPVLADRGLAHAVRALALDAPLPVELDIDLPGRLSPPVESACYFGVAELLANVVKHAGAHRVHIRIQHAAGLLRIEVADDGTGGADPAAGTGLAGVERRLGTFDGILAVSSPPGGPTMIVMEVPCELSSRKTCSC